MARVLRIADVTQTDTIDLLAGTWALEQRSWTTRGPSPNLDLISETVNLIASSNDLTIADAAAEIDERLEKVRLFHADPNNNVSYWLETNTADEQARRALLYNGSTAIGTGIGYGPLFEQDTGVLSLAVDRHPLWESPTSTSITTSALTINGSAASLPTVAGTAPARMYQVDAYGDTGGDLTPISEVWIGIRPDYTSSADFVPLWEAELGDSTSTDTSEQADVTASGGKVMQCDFTTAATLTDRVTIIADDVTASTNFHHFKGRYLVLARVKASAASTTIGLQLRPGYYRNATDSAYATCEETYITNTVWRLVPLGEVQIPPEGAYTGQTTAHLQYFGFSLWAERVSGTGKLDFDYLCLIPAEHLVYLNGANIIENPNPHYYEAQLLTHENDKQIAIAWYNEGLKGNLEYSFRDWYLPIGNNKVVVAAQPEALGHELDHTLTLYFYYYTRWRTYRGSGTT